MVLNCYEKLEDKIFLLYISAEIDGIEIEAEPRVESILKSMLQTSDHDLPSTSSTSNPSTTEEVKVTGESDDETGRLVIDEDPETLEASTTNQEKSFSSQKKPTTSSPSKILCAIRTKNNRSPNRVFAMKPGNLKYLSPLRIVRSYKKQNQNQFKNRLISNYLAMQIKKGSKNPVSSVKSSKHTRAKECALRRNATGDSSSSDDVDACEIVPEKTSDPLQTTKPISTSIDDKLGKCGTTLTKVTVPAVERVFTQPIIKKPDEKPSTSNKVSFYPASSTEYFKVVSLRRHPKKSSPPYTKPTKPITFPSITVRKDLITPQIITTPPPKTISSECQPSTSTSASTVPQFAFAQPETSPTAGFNKVRLQKSANGTYKIVNTANTKSLPPESFPKAIVYPKFDLKKLLLDTTNVPRTSTNLPPATNARQAEPSSIKSPAPIQKKILIYPEFIDDDSSSDDARPQPEARKTFWIGGPSNQPSRVKPPALARYIIPQDLLLSPSNTIKRVAKVKPALLEPTANIENFDDSDLFVIEDEPEDEEKKTTETVPKSLKNQRKTALVPKTDNDEMSFEEPPFQMLPRPQANIDLIDNLAKYRVLVGSILKKLKMPQIDFNEDGDEYINMYKILRT